MAISHRLMCKTIALWPIAAALSTPHRGTDQDRDSLRESGKKWARRQSFWTFDLRTESGGTAAMLR
jgi:hypothetical protein